MDVSSTECVYAGSPGCGIFECRRCGTCCLGRGGARLDEAQAEKVAAHLGLPLADVARLYLDPGPPPWDIGVGDDGFCLFHQPDGRCRIHPVKPEVCRQWPYLQALLTRESAFSDALQACPGLRPGLTWAEFKAAREKDGQP